MFLSLASKNVACGIAFDDQVPTVCTNGPNLREAWNLLTGCQGCDCTGCAVGEVQISAGFDVVDVGLSLPKTSSLSEMKKCRMATYLAKSLLSNHEKDVSSPKRAIGTPPISFPLLSARLPYVLSFLKARNPLEPDCALALLRLRKNRDPE
jgi:hypothetical protein